MTELSVMRKLTEATKAMASQWPDLGLVCTTSNSVSLKLVRKARETQGTE